MPTAFRWMLPLLAMLAAARADLPPEGTVVKLWPDGAPLATGTAAADTPTLTVFPAAPDKVTGAAIIVLPGGGYTTLSDREGAPIARWLAQNGVTAFVLKYRHAPAYRHPAPLLDAQRAIRYVRAHHAEWGLDPARVGILGFSAGGHLASTAATQFDNGQADSPDPVERAGSRPDLQILVYPVITLTDEPNVHQGSRNALLGPEAAAEQRAALSSETRVQPNSPPAFVIHSTADRVVPVANADLYVQALMKQNIPVVYLRANYGGHGFGLTPAWTPQGIAWLRAMRFAPEALPPESATSAPSGGGGRGRGPRGNPPPAAPAAPAASVPPASVPAAP